MHTTAKSSNFFERFAAQVTQAAGSTTASLIAFVVVILWAMSGPFFEYSETWQLVINTGTTIVTFLMVFLIQKSQNKDSLAIQLKLNELVASHRQASNRLIDVEDLSEEELRLLHAYYLELSNRCKQEQSLHKTHTIDEALDNHKEKVERHRSTRPGQ